jgi:ArsR family transcriptional regulator
MKALIEAGLVASEKRGLWVYYRLLPDALRGLAETLSALADCADVTEGTTR